MPGAKQRRARTTRRIAVCVFVSALLHTLLLCLRWPGGDTEAIRLRVMQPRRNAPRRLWVSTVPRALDSAPRLRPPPAKGPPLVLAVPAGPPPVAEPSPSLTDSSTWSRRPSVRDTAGVPASRDVLDYLAAPASRSYDLPRAPDPVLLDAERRRRSVVLVDPANPRRLSACIYLPATGGRPGGRRALDMADHARRGTNLGTRVDDAVDLTIRLRLFPPGHSLSLNELLEFPMVWTRMLDVHRSQGNLAAYMEQGGVVLADLGEFGLLEDALETRCGARLRRVYLTLEHPLYRSFYTIDRYHYFTDRILRNPCMRSVLPVDALCLDDRVVAISTYMTYDPGFYVKPASRRIEYNWWSACVANRLALNVFIYGLVRPGAVAGRYVHQGSAPLSRTPDHGCGTACTRVATSASSRLAGGGLGTTSACCGSNGD